MWRALFLFSTLTAQSVLVTIPPEAYLVERIAGDTVGIETLIPAGADPHTFEPTPRGAIEAAKADIWFRMGEQSEQRVMQAIASHNPDMRVVDMRSGMPLLGGHECPHCSHGTKDPHFWLSPVLARRMAIRIAATLSRKWPENRQLYQENLRTLLRDLNDLNQDLLEQLAPFRGQALLVSHAALAYFCRDFGLVQIPLELEGREASTRQIVEIVEEARGKRVRRVILQEAYNPKGAEQVARELDVPICRFDELDQDLITNLRYLGDCIAAE